MNSKKVSIVIGSGGIKCAAAIGLVKVLEAEGIPIDLVVGCSGGSMYAALIAAGVTAEAMQERTLFLWTSEIMKDYTSNLKATQDGSLRFNERSGLVDDSVMNERLHAAFDEYRFEGLARPLRLVATDLMRGERVVLEKGSLFDAVRASLAIPLIFPPWEVNGQLLVDGAAVDPLPVDVAIQEGAEVIIAMGFMLSNRGRMRSMTAVQQQLNNIYMNNLLKATYAFYNLAHHAEIFPILPDFEEPLGMFDTDKLPDIIARGEAAARAELPRIVRLLEA
ncbi:MAG: patatin-like phospholipase family protein [Chloroflexi bacterium]|nr:patatin-like phospholipase family protein [Chloroflexota bacterium]